MSTRFASDEAEASEVRTRFTFWFIALALGLIIALSRRAYMWPDGISYLDMGDAFWRRDWHGAINGYWSPVYGWSLGVVLNLFHVGPRWEFLSVQLVNFGIYGLALVSFDFFLRALIAYHRANTRRHGDAFATLPTSLWYGLGFTMFIWSSLEVITVFIVTPDMLSSAVVYLACGLLIGMRTEFVGLRPFGFLGALLGLGYLTRASMFPLAFVFLGAALVLTFGFRRSLSGTVLGLVIFLLVSAPFIAALSLKEGHLSLGDSAKLNYAAEVNHAFRMTWRGGSPGCGTPRHPTRKILESPAVYEFATPIVATYAPWFDTAYWNDGAVPCFHLANQLRALGNNVKRIFDVTFGRAGALAAAIIAISYWLVSTGHRRLLIQGLVDNTYLLIIACAGFAAYVWILVEPRYIGVFATLLWLGLFSAMRLPRTPQSTQIVRAVVVAAIAVTLVMVGRATFDEVQNGTWHSPRNVQWEVAESLGQMGIRPGDKVAAFGPALERPYWARLARVRIVAEIRDAREETTIEDFWAATPAVRAKAIDALLSTGAKVIVTSDIPSASDRVGWKRMGPTEFFVYTNRR